MSKKNSKTAVAEALCHALADGYMLYVKTQNYHWNVTGPHFAGLHALFQTQYEDLAAAIDETAERVRALGSPAPGSLAAFARLASVKEETGAPDWRQMLKTLSGDQAKIVETLQAALDLAQETGDEATADLMITRIAQHQKNKWMLDAHLA